MKKVTERLLTVCLAALAVGACQDTQTVVQPAPPPPPPPPPTVESTVTIQGLRAIPSNMSVNPTGVAGDINVVLNVEENDEEVVGIDLLFDGDPIGCTTISSNAVPGEQVSLSSSGSSDVVECFFNTDDVAGACVGEQLDPAFPNGTFPLGARITTAGGETRDATNVQQITLVNTDFLLLTMLPGAQSVVSGGVTYYGGPRDLDGDGTDDNPVDFAVCPVSYNDITVASLGLMGIQPDTNPVDFGAGPGATATDASSPFVFSADPTDNDIASGNPVEDDVGTFSLTGGHVISTAGTILDDNGLNVTANFPVAATGEIFLDFTAPQPNMGGVSEVTVGGASAVPGTWYSAGGFGLTFVTENGVGWSFGNGAVVDVGDCSAAENIDMDPSTAFTADIAGATGIADHTEDDWEAGGDGFGAADAGGLDCYLAELQVLADDLQNAFDLTTLAATIQNVTFDVGGDADLDSYGADFTAPTESNVLPASNVVLNPDANADGGVCADAGDCTVMLDLADPDLASADPGSGVDFPSITAEDEGGAALGVAGVAPTLSVDISGLADGPHTVTVDAPDSAVPANVLTVDIDFDLDDTAPVHGALNPAPTGSTGTDAGAIVMTIGGTIDDAHIIDTAVLAVFDGVADGDLDGNFCNDGDEVKLAVGAAANEVSQNDVDITDGTNAISFNESFTIQQPSTAASTVNYCFVITAEDEAVLKDGTDSGNMSTLTTQVAVTWNAG